MEHGCPIVTLPVEFSIQAFATFRSQNRNSVPRATGKPSRAPRLAHNFNIAKPHRFFEFRAPASTAPPSSACKSRLASPSGRAPIRPPWPRTTAVYGFPWLYQAQPQTNVLGAKGGRTQPRVLHRLLASLIHCSAAPVIYSRREPRKSSLQRR